MCREADDEDYRIEAIEYRRAMRRAHTCQCGDDLPGRCPGPANCPYSDFAVAEESEDTTAPQRQERT